ncbi:MAG: hypothetical protein Q3990_05865 [Desulfovibrionaceae bacterium]|nr:hypothetical protein [Desulfovibrionaceae bacterium]
MKSIVLRAACGILFGVSLLLQPSHAFADNTPNAFNSYTGKPMPVSRVPKGDEARILSDLGGKPRSIATDTAYRANSKQELYPCLFGTPQSAHEVLAVIDFARPESKSLWAAVCGAVKKVSPAKAKVVLFGKSDEAYSIDLTGLAIWAARERSGQSMDYLTWALNRWHEIKDGLKKRGEKRIFRHEYDAVLDKKDFPMVFTAMTKCFRPAVSEKDQSTLAKYAYEAGNVNLFQATEVIKYYDVEKLPALVVDGKVYYEMTADKLASLLQ